MQTLHFSIFINAPREKVWDVMLNEPTYSEWTKVFSPDPSSPATFRGNWEAGSKMLFVSQGEGGESGMVSRIKENRPHEFISIEHIGMIQNGVEDTTSDMVKAWIPAFENYTFTEKDGGTELTVDVDVADEFKEEFEQHWPQGLETLKQIAER